jgi:chromate transporter
MNPPAFYEALRFWLKLGFISFGGPAGQIAIMHEYLVEKKRWISDSKFLHALNYCMLLPGPEAQQLAIYTGWLLHGTLGGLMAGLLFVLPSMFILLIMSVLYVTYGNLPWVYAMFDGLKPAVIAIVILALIKIGKKALTTPFHYVVAGAAFVGISFLNIPFPLIVLGTIVVAALFRRILPQIFQQKQQQAVKQTTNEADYYLNQHSVVAGTGFEAKRLVRQIIIAVLLWTLPIGLLSVLAPDFAFWRTLTLFFTQAAFVTFGGAYAVLPYVAQVSVEKLQWLNSLQMLDGLALGETTPGPLIMVLAFVGFMAGYNHFDGSLWMGALGLVTTTFYTFLPSFLFIFAGAPIIETTQTNKAVKEILSIVTSAVVGVVLNLTFYLAEVSIVPGVFATMTIDLMWVLISLIAMSRFKVSMMLWLGVSALFGWIIYIAGL